MRQELVIIHNVSQMERSPRDPTIVFNRKRACSSFEKSESWRMPQNGFPGVVDLSNWKQFPCPVKLTSGKYRDLSTRGVYHVLADDPAAVWYQQLMGKPWDRTAGSFAYARRRYFEWFRNKDARQEQRKHRRLEKIAHSVLTQRLPLSPLANLQ